MRFKLILLALFFTVRISAQVNQDADLKSIILANGDFRSINVITDSMASVLPDKRVFLRTEIHAIGSNYFTHNFVLKALHKHKHVNYILGEYNHSLLFGWNLFLKYGDKNIIRDFEWTDSVKSDSVILNKKYFELIKLYEYNKKQNEAEQISFLGLDVNLVNTQIRPHALDEYVTSIKYLKRYSKHKLPVDIEIIFDKMIASRDYFSLLELDTRLQELSKMHVPELKNCFGSFYKDYYLIVYTDKAYTNAYRRDLNFVKNLESAFKIIKEDDPVANPKFFGSFGMSHIQPGNKDSFCSMLNDSRIFKNDVSLIGTGYNNSVSYYDELRPVKYSGAAIDHLTSKQRVLANHMIDFITESNHSLILLLGRFDRLPNRYQDFLKYYDAFFIFNGF